MNIDQRLEDELRHFDAEDQRQMFRSILTAPRTYSQTWQYGSEEHRCTVVAADGGRQVVYCPTGFGPEFPWSVQAIGERDLGMDSLWHAYLYEAFVTSPLWLQGSPAGFMLKARGER